MYYKLVFNTTVLRELRKDSSVDLNIAIAWVVLTQIFKLYSDYSLMDFIVLLELMTKTRIISSISWLK